MGLGDINFLIVDVDGVLTDGRIFCSDRGEELKVFHVKDGSGIAFWHRVGKKTAIISGRKSKAVTHRAKELGIEEVYQDAHKKLDAYGKILERHGLKDEEVCYIGDDLIDLPLLSRVGFAVAVAGSPPEVLQEADYVTRARGGQGAVREVVEKILRYQGKWEDVLRRYT
ncbi:MAG: HAD-IIIA family hydrolase [Planctomycetes bacterium]|nr:HAD-IIIA family hydrolase [Planctomycetota bacterium]